MKKNVILCLLIAIAFAACKKDFNVKKEREIDQVQNSEEGFEEYYQIIDFLNAYDDYTTNSFSGENKLITEAEWLMEAAINMRHGNTTKYVEYLESSTKQFSIPLDIGNSANLSFNNMMDSLAKLMEWTNADLDEKDVFFVDIQYNSSTSSNAEFTITKQWGTITDLRTAITTPVPFSVGEGYGAIFNESCNWAWGNARDQFTNRINAATGNFGMTQQAGMIWAHITIISIITSNSYCSPCTTCCPSI